MASSAFADYTSILTHGVNDQGVLVQIDPGVQHIDILDEVPDEKQSRKDLVGNIKLLHLSGAMSMVAIAIEPLEVQLRRRAVLAF